MDLGPDDVGQQVTTYIQYSDNVGVFRTLVQSVITYILNIGAANES